MAYANGKNPFMDEDDDLFGSRGRAAGGGSKYSEAYGRGYGDDPPPYDDGQLSRREMVQQQMQHSVNRQLESTQRCLAGIYESEQIGVATAEVGCLLMLLWLCGVKKAFAKKTFT
jgi:hypothetical protein